MIIRLLLITFMLLFSSCMFEKGKIEVKRFTSNNATSNTTSSASVTSVSIVNDQLVISGSDLDGVTSVQITGPSSFDHTFVIESKSATSLIANGVSAIAFAMDSVFSLTLTNANGAATFPVTFTLQDGAVTASKLDSMGATTGQFLKFDKKKIEIISFTSLTTDLCKRYKSNIILRGLRAVSDFEYEFQLAGMNRKLNNNIETIFLMSDVENQIISSKFVKEIIRLKGNIKKFTTKSIIKSLKEKYE